MVKSKKLSFTDGPIFWRIILFALPIMATGILQILYSMADNIVVGQFSGDPLALGAVGSTSSLVNLTINLLIGISVGTSVVVSQAYGAKNEKMVSRSVHTALIFALFGGLTFMGIGFAISRPALVLMGTRPELLEKALLYFRIICIGIPATAVYNFGAAVLRSVGDSKSPLIILASTGLVNVGLNFFFVIVCHMTVDGVAIATITSQYLSAIAVVLVLFIKRAECYGFSPSKLVFDTTLLARILRFGIPSGLQSSIFSISNILLTSGINSLGTSAITAYTISNNIDALTFTACNSFHHGALTFTGQNFGANKPDRIKKIIIYSLIQVTVAGVLVGQTVLLLGKPIAGMYVNASDPNYTEIMTHTLDIMKLLLNTYFICGIMDVLSGALKGLGYSVIPMAVSLVCICGFRIVWRFAVFPLERFNTPTGLMLCYVFSWSLAAITFALLVIFALTRINKKKNQ